ncbi:MULTISPECIES: phage head closure protein [Falsihalocynthiibacter]|uniref:phage head closure protein n=1 Tax=Falsihalocynthiibacter TaxID=2854182 RepID=UPI0030010B85
MSVPKLNRQLVLEAPERVADNSGGFVEKWAALGTHWAAIDPGAAREKAGDFLTISSTSLKITVRAAPYGAPSRPKADQRFIEGARIYRIQAVTDAYESGQYLVCICQEEVVS